MKVIKVESQAHALEVKKYFESQGYNADHIRYDEKFQYWGIDDLGQLDGFKKSQLSSYGMEIIKLPFPRMMMVSDGDGDLWRKRFVLGIFNGNYLVADTTCKHISDIDVITLTSFWLEAKEIESVKVTIEELMDCYAKEHGIAVENLKL